MYTKPHSTTKALISKATNHYYPIIKNLINPSKDTSIKTTNLIKSYIDKGRLDEARNLFEKMPDRDVVTWTTMISGYVSCDEHVFAWSTFCEMVRSGVEPNAYTLSSVLKACKCIKDVALGGLVHGLAIKFGIEGFIYVGTALMDMYAACCETMKEARAVFDGIEEVNSVSWTTLIAGYAHRGQGHLALEFFHKMQLKGEALEPYSFSIAVAACASIGSKSSGEKMHATAVKIGFDSNLPITNSILDMYCKCGSLTEACQCFHEINPKDLISWNTLIAGYEKSDSSESCVVFSEMLLEGISPNVFTFSSVIAACANLSALNYGQQVHGGILRRGLMENISLANALIDLYAKCGKINSSYKVFSEMSCRDLVSWTTLLFGYGAHGYGKQAMDLFDRMVLSGITPDQLAFVAVLSACSRAGLVDQGFRYFTSMLNDYNMKHDQKIYGCVVDLLGRAGRVDEAYQLIQSMPFEPDETIWGALLGACTAHKVPSLGIVAAQKILDLRPDLAGTYVALSNMYAAEGEWDKLSRIRKLMKEVGSQKEGGRSWIEVRNEVSSFVAGDKVGSDIELVCEVLELLIWDMREAGYVTIIDDMDEEE